MRRSVTGRLESSPMSLTNPSPINPIRPHQTPSRSDETSTPSWTIHKPFLRNMGDVFWEHKQFLYMFDPRVYSWDPPEGSDERTLITILGDCASSHVSSLQWRILSIYPGIAYTNYKDQVNQLNVNLEKSLYMNTGSQYSIFPNRPSSFSACLHIITDNYTHPLLIVSIHIFVFFLRL